MKLTRAIIVSLILAMVVGLSGCLTVNLPETEEPIPTPAPAPAHSPTEEILYTMRGSDHGKSWVMYGKYLHAGENVQAIVNVQGEAPVSGEYEEWLCNVLGSTLGSEAAANARVCVIAGDFSLPLGESLGLDFSAEGDGWNYIFIEHHSAEYRNLLIKLPAGWQQTACGYSEDELVEWLKQHFPATYPAPATAPTPVPAPAPEPAFVVTNKPTGPSAGEVDQTLTYSTGAGSNIAGSPEYRFEWGDGSYSNWSSSVNASHSWVSSGTYTIRARTRYGYISSEWSSGKTIVIEAEALPETEKLSRQPMGQPEAMMSYITPDDPEIENAVEDILSGEWRWAYNDYNSLREWASTHVSYVYDQSVHGTSEHWQLPAETLNLGTGDCEDFAILLCTLLRAYGVPSDQVYVACAYSEGAEHGHAFLFERWYKGIWRAIEPQEGVWGVFVWGDIDPSEYDRFYCFNDQEYLTDKPAPPLGEYEFEAGYSFWPATRGASVEFERYLDAGERVTGLVEWGKNSLGEVPDIVYDWTITSYDQYDNPVFTWSGTELSHDFSFTASQTGIYRIEILKRDYLARCGRMTIEPEDWAQN